MGYFPKKTIYLVLVMILAVAMQGTVASAFFTTESTLKSSGLINYSQSPSLARPLHVEGNKIKNDLGEVIHLRGWQKHYQVDEACPIWGNSWNIYKQSAVDLVLNKMSSYGSNVLREFISANTWIKNLNVQTEQGTMSYRAALNDLLTRAEQHGIYVIISTWCIYPLNCPIHGNGGCVAQDRAPWDPYTTSGHQGVIPNSSAFVDYIVSIADALGSHNNLIIEPTNEVFYGYTGATYANLWQTVYQSCINGVRANENSHGFVHHLILCQLNANIAIGNLNDPCWNFNWYWTNPLSDSDGNLIYGQHIYRTYGALGDSKPYTYGDLKAIYQLVRMDDISAEVPVFISEIGADLTNDADNREYLFLQNSLQILNEWNISYQPFVWCGDGTPFDMLMSGTEYTTGGTVNKYGQILVDAIKQGAG